MIGRHVSLVGLEYRLDVLLGLSDFATLADLVHECITDARQRLYALDLELAISEHLASRLPDGTETLWGQPVHVVHDDEAEADLTIRRRPSAVGAPT